MTTGDEKAHEEYERLMREIELAQARELHRLTTSNFHRRAPAIALGGILMFALGVLVAIGVVAATVLSAH